MISFTTDMEKLLISVRFSTVKLPFKAAALSFLLAAAFLLNSSSCFAAFSIDTRPFEVPALSAAALDLGTAYVTRAALGALGVEIGASLLDATPDDVVRAMWYGGGSTLPPSFTFAQNLVEYFSRQTIRIRPDSITIGGVEYSDVWLPYDAADKFRTNAFDFITRYNLTSQSNGTFVTGSGSFDGIPIFRSGNTLISQNYVIPEWASYPFGNGTLDAYAGYANNTRFNWHSSIGSTGQLAAYSQVLPAVISITVSSNNDGVTFNAPVGSQFISFSGLYDATPFDFTWVSSYIPVEPLPSSYGLRTRLPSTYVRDLPQILDPESATYQSDLASLISGIESSASDGTLVDPAFEEWDTPIPPTSNTIADEPYSSLSGSLSGIQSIINNISTSVSGIAESIVGADSTFFGNIVSALATPFEPVFAVFRSGVGIWRYVVSWVGTISVPFSWSLSALGSAGSYFLSPIYAAAAAAVVLAVYKKFGR